MGVHDFGFGVISKLLPEPTPTYFKFQFFSVGNQFHAGELFEDRTLSLSSGRYFSCKYLSSSNGSHWEKRELSHIWLRPSGDLHIRS